MQGVTNQACSLLDASGGLAGRARSGIHQCFGVAMAFISATACESQVAAHSSVLWHASLKRQLIHQRYGVRVSNGSPWPGAHAQLGWALWSHSVAHATKVQQSFTWAQSSWSPHTCGCSCSPDSVRGCDDLQYSLQASTYFAPPTPPCIYCDVCGYVCVMSSTALQRYVCTRAC